MERKRRGKESSHGHVVGRAVGREGAEGKRRTESKRKRRGQAASFMVSHSLECQHLLLKTSLLLRFVI